MRIGALETAERLGGYPLKALILSLSMLLYASSAWAQAVPQMRTRLLTSLTK